MRKDRRPRGESSPRTRTAKPETKHLSCLLTKKLICLYRGRIRPLTRTPALIFLALGRARLPQDGRLPCRFGML